jgi:hypothetical protein
MNWNSKWINLIFLFAFVILMVYGVVAYLEIRGEGLQCVNNPFEYTIKYTQKNLGSDLMCSCNLQDNKFSAFIFSKEGIKPIDNGNVRTNVLDSNFNISKLNLTN